MTTAFRRTHPSTTWPRPRLIQRGKLLASPLAPIARMVLVLALALAGEPGLILAYAALLFWMFRGARQTVEALFLMVIIGHLNPGIFAIEGSSVQSLLRWLLILAGFGLSVHRMRRRFPSTLKWAYLFAATACFASAISSYALDVSLFKLVAFVLGITAVFLSVQQANCTPDYWRQWFLTFFALIVILGFPLLLHPLGYVRNGRGFQGLLNQPQAYAVFLAPGLAWLIVLLFTRELRSRLWWGLAALGFVSLTATQGRTGIASFILGTGIALLMTLLIGPWRRSGKYVLEACFLATLVAVPVVIWQYDWLASRADALIGKGREIASIGDAYDKSRGRLMQASLDDLHSRPLVGIGFGVASNPWELSIERDPVLNLPISAPTEKGNVYLAVLGETGLVGTSAFALMILSILATSRSRGAGALAVALAALLTNFGEATLLSIGGIGLYLWLLIAISSQTHVLYRRRVNDPAHRPFLPFPSSIRPEHIHSPADR